MSSPLAGLGRLRIPDDRDHNHLMPRLASARTSRYWATPAAYDQLSTPMCVAYAGNRYLESAPVRNKPYSFAWLYRQAQMADDWPGEDYEGTSVRALFKVLQREKLVSGYKWGFSVEPVIDHLLEVGPVVMGTDWKMGMADPDRHGYLSATGESLGGHAWTIIGVSKTKVNPDRSFGAVRMVNSWGPRWGADNGRAWVSLNDLARLIAEDGEAAIGVELQK